MDWGAPVTGFGVKTDDFELKWSDDEDDKVTILSFYLNFLLLNMYSVVT